MENLDPTTVTSWPQALVMVVLIIAVLVVPSVLAQVGNRRIKTVETQLTKTNGGSTHLDQMNRIEKGIVELNNSVDDLSGRVSNLEDVAFDVNE